MNRRTFLKWFGASAVVAATTDPMELLEGLAKEEVVVTPEKVFTGKGITDFSRLTAIMRENILPNVSDAITRETPTLQRILRENSKA